MVILMRAEAKPGMNFAKTADTRRIAAQTSQQVSEYPMSGATTGKTYTSEYHVRPFCSVEQYAAWCSIRGLWMRRMIAASSRLLASCSVKCRGSCLDIQSRPLLS